MERRHRIAEPHHDGHDEQQCRRYGDVQAVLDNTATGAEVVRIAPSVALFYQQNPSVDARAAHFPLQQAAPYVEGTVPCASRQAYESSSRQRLMMIVSSMGAPIVQ